jgi:hypothetical protein
MIAVALIAFTLASLKYANQEWAMVLSAAFFLALLAALIVSLLDRGSRQAFAIGFSLTLVACSLPFSWSSVIGSLPTDRLLRRAYDAFRRVEYVDSRTDKVITNFDPSNPSLPFAPSPPRGYDPAVGYAIGLQAPPQHLYLAIGRRWFAFLLAGMGGLFAQFVYRRRMRDEQKLPAETS